jgi:hypothetical protein
MRFQVNGTAPFSILTGRQPASLRRATSITPSYGPAWLSDRDEIDYATTQKGDPFRNAAVQVSRKSVADLVVKLATTPNLEIGSSLSVHKAT